MGRNARQVSVDSNAKHGNEAPPGNKILWSGYSALSISAWIVRPDGGLGDQSRLGQLSRREAACEERAAGTFASSCRPHVLGARVAATSDLFRDERNFFARRRKAAQVAVNRARHEAVHASVNLCDDPSWTSSLSRAAKCMPAPSKQGKKNARLRSLPEKCCACCLSVRQCLTLDGDKARSAVSRIAYREFRFFCTTRAHTSSMTPMKDRSRCQNAGRSPPFLARTAGVGGDPLNASTDGSGCSPRQ